MSLEARIWALRLNLGLETRTSVITIDHFRKTHILNQNKPVSEHLELLIKAKIITFISCGRYLEG